MLTAYLDVPAILFPAWFIRWTVLQPHAKAAKGTVDGMCLALRHGWAINLMGGFTHCTTNFGDQFHVYPDITLAIHYAKKWHGAQCKRILVINTSVCQANGVARDMPADDSVYLCDIYDPQCNPKDQESRYKINQSATVGEFDNDESYISKVSHRVNLSISSFNPDFVIFVAGYDCLNNDKKGNMNISESVLIFRDELIFRMCKEGMDIPILMVIKGANQTRQEATIARSIRNLVVKFDLSKKPLELGASENIKLMYKTTRKGGMRGGNTDKFGRFDTFANTDRDSASGLVSPGSHVGGGRSTGVGARAPDGAVKAARPSNAYENDPVVSRLTQKLINKNEIGVTDNFSYRR
jgi:histone deacetylase 11